MQTRTPSPGGPGVSATSFCESPRRFRLSHSEPVEGPPRQFAGEGCKCRYIRYALIEPVVLNNFQKTSEVRMCVGGPSPVVRCAGVAGSARASIAPPYVAAKS